MSSCFGAYRVFKDPFDRPFGSGAKETVDDSVRDRWRYDRDSRSPSLARHLNRPQQ